jgi:hypothetical protein
MPPRRRSGARVWLGSVGEWAEGGRCGSLPSVVWFNQLDGGVSLPSGACGLSSYGPGQLPGSSSPN